MLVKLKKLHPSAKTPRYAKTGDAAFDIFATEAHFSGKTCELATGWSCEVPPGYGLFIFSRSGHGFKHGMRLANCVGIIDSGYRGEVKVKLTLDGDSWGGLDTDVAVAQGVVLPIEQAEFQLTEALSDSERGVGGFGSTSSERSCRTCKYVDKSVFRLPCRGCAEDDDFPNWEPK